MLRLLFSWCYTFNFTAKFSQMLSRLLMLLVNERSDAHVDSVVLSAYLLRRDREDLATATIFLVLEPRRVSCGAANFDE
jgi:hypothetical protein